MSKDIDLLSISMEYEEAQNYLLALANAFTAKGAPSQQVRRHLKSLAEKLKAAMNDNEFEKERLPFEL